MISVIDCVMVPSVRDVVVVCSGAIKACALAIFSSHPNASWSSRLGPSAPYVEAVVVSVTIPDDSFIVCDNTL